VDTHALEPVGAKQVIVEMHLVPILGENRDLIRSDRCLTKSVLDESTHDSSKVRIDPGALSGITLILTASFATWPPAYRSFILYLEAHQPK
jgi:hypothetical protein